MAVIYEWDVETVTAIDSEKYEENEVLDHHFCKSYREAMEVSKATPPDGCRFEIVLVRDDDKSRAWAYIVDGKLPKFAEDAYGNKWCLVPKRYHDEVMAVPA